jgi:hypothetical protein
VRCAGWAWSQQLPVCPVALVLAGCHPPWGLGSPGSLGSFLIRFPGPRPCLWQEPAGLCISGAAASRLQVPCRAGSGQRTDLSASEFLSPAETRGEVAPERLSRNPCRAHPQGRAAVPAYARGFSRSGRVNGWTTCRAGCEPRSSLSSWDYRREPLCPQQSIIMLTLRDNS